MTNHMQRAGILALKKSRANAGKKHIKMRVTDGGTVTHEVVWWNGGVKLSVGKLDLAFAPQVNEFNGRHTVQLKILDWQPA